MRCNKFSIVRVAAALTLSLCVNVVNYAEGSKAIKHERPVAGNPNGASVSK